MKILDQSNPCWPKVSSNLSTLTQNKDADVAIVGGGITGLLSAYALALRKKSVILVDRHDLGQGETGRTTSHLTSFLDQRYYRIIKTFGAENAALLLNSHQDAIELYRNLATDCAFAEVDAYLFSHDVDELKREQEAINFLGKNNLQIVNQEASNAFMRGPALKYTRQARLNPSQLITGLINKLLRLNIQIHPHTAVTHFEDGSPCQLRTENGAVIKARNVIIATDTPVNDRVVIHTKQAAYRSYVIAIKIPRGSIFDALYYDSEDPYHYIRIEPHDEENDFLIVGGEDHKTGQANNQHQRYQNLVHWTKKHFKNFDSVEYTWSGQIMEPVDNIAYIGLNPFNHYTYLATGYAGNGWTWAMIASQLLTELICGKKDHPLQALLDPRRRTIKEIKEYCKENINTFAQYRRWLSSDIKSTEELDLDSGAVVQEGLHKTAAFKDKNGKIRRCSAVCPHLGAIIAYNPGEKSWDCPAHGSRFSADGAVLHGPSNKSLAKLKKD